jgi:AraC-like DNA-binding protein
MILMSLYGVFIISIKQNQVDSTKQLLGQLVSEVDNLKTDVDNVMSIITSDSTTLKFVQDSKENKMNNYYLFLQLQEIKSAYSYMENIAVINFNNNKCIEAIGNNGSGTNNIEFATSMLEQQRFIGARVIRQSQKAINVISFVQYLPYYNAAVIEDVNANLFQYSINEDHLEAREVYIVDVDGSAVTNSTLAMIEEQPLTDYFYSIITEQEKTNKSFVYDDKIRRQLVFFSKSEEFGWWFIDLQDYSYFYSRFQSISAIFIGIALVLVILCSLLSVIFNKKIRKPLTKLVEQYRNMMGSEDYIEADELKYLDTALARGKHEMYLRERYIRTLYLHNLMIGEQMPLFVPQKDIISMETQYKADFYCVMLLRIQNLEQLEDSVREEEYKLYRYIIGNLSDEIFGSSFHCKAVDMGEELVGVLFFLDEKAIAEEYVLFFKQLKDFAERTFRITVSGSLGQIVDRQKDIVVSYQKARQYLEMNQLISREELIDSNNQVSINYQEKNKKLVESILEYTEYNFNNPELSLKNISQIFGLSTTYLGKIFKSIQGEAYSTYVTNYRLEKSKLALLQTTKTVNEIASEIGFTNSTYFATLFKNTYGMTPTAFRNRSNK